MEPSTLHLDPGVLTIIGTLIFQTMGIVWWAATTTRRLQEVEREQCRYKEQNSAIVSQLQSMSQMQVRADVKIDLLMEFLKRKEHGGE